MSKRRKPSKKLRRKEKQQNKKRVSELLAKPFKDVVQSTQQNIPIKAIVNGVIITKDNRYVKVLEFNASKFTSMTRAQRYALTEGFQRVLNILPDRFQMTAMTFPSDISDKLDELERDVSKETNDKCRKIDYEYRMKLIQSSQNSFSKRYFLSYEFVPEKGTTLTAEDIINEMNRTAIDIINAFRTIDNEVILKINDDLKGQTSTEATLQTAEILYTIFNRDKPGQHEFDNKMYRVSKKYYEANPQNTLIPVNDILAPGTMAFIDSHYAMINGLYYSFLYIPSTSYYPWVEPGWLDNITGTVPGIDVNVYAQRMQSEKMSNKIRMSGTFSRSNATNSSTFSKGGQASTESLAANTYFQNVLSDNEDFYYVATLITVCGDSPREVEEKIRTIRNAARALKIRGIPTTLYENESAFLSTLPLARLNNGIWERAKRNVATTGMSSFYLYTNYLFNEKNGVYYGVNQDGSLVIINSFNRALRGGNGNMFIFGTTGAGKSYTMFLLAIRHRIKQIPIWMIIPEKEKEAIRLCEEIGGTFVQIAAQSKDIINIMDIHIKDKTKTAFTDGNRDDVPALSDKVEFLRAFFSMIYQDMDDDKYEILEDAIIKTYAKKGITSDDNSLYADKENKVLKEMPILQDLQETLYEKYKKLETEGRENNNQIKLELAVKAERLARGLKRYVSGNFRSLNGHTNVNLNSGFVVFGLEHLRDNDLALGLFMVMDYVWSRVKENRYDKSMIFVDEFWRMLTNGATSDYFVNIARTVRGYNSSLTVATQSILDVMKVGGNNNNFVSNMLGFFSTQFVMKQQTNEVELIEKELHLNHELANQLPKFQSGDAYMLSGATTTRMRFVASETEDYLINTSGDRLKEIEEQKLKEQKEKEFRKRQAKLKQLELLNNKDEHEEMDLIQKQDDIVENLDFVEEDEVEDLSIKNLQNDDEDEIEQIDFK